MTIRKITVTSGEVSDDANISTGAFDLPAGTTAQRPGSPTDGNIRYNTDLDTTEIYAEGSWGKVSPLTPTLTAATGNIYTSFAVNLALAGTNFLTANLVVSFTPAGGSASTVTISPSSDTSATVAVPSAIYNLAGGTVVSITVTNSDNRTSPVIQKTVLGIPTGGDHIVTDGLTRTHIFKQSANFVVPNQLTNVDFLVVAGGGQGGRWYRGGGGGAGGVRSSISQTGGGGSVESKLTMTAATHAITVGAGGTSAQANNSNPGANGGNSSIGSQIVSVGGGGGGSYSAQNGQSGGSGGGGAGSGSHTSGGNGSGTAGQGYDGGQTSSVTSIQCGGGGGGAGAVGQRGGNSSDGGGTRGFGGVGVTNTIISTTVATAQSVGEVSGGNVYYGGGGAGSSYGSGNSNVTSGGGLGGGADGVFHSGSDYRAGVAGAANTGGGGSGANGQVNATNASVYPSLSNGDYLTGGDGGSGVVIIKYTLS